MNERPRFHQSQAKTLIQGSAWELQQQLLAGWKPSRAMQEGSLFDALVMGRDDLYELVVGAYKSGPRKGKEWRDWTTDGAREERERILAAGKTPALPCEIDALRDHVDRTKARLARLLEGGGAIITQQTIQWTSAEGVECEGTPDWCYLFGNRVHVVDLKYTGRVSPRGIQQQVFGMCWDVQAAAYREAALEWARGIVDAPEYGGHTILAAENGRLERVFAYPLDETSVTVGATRWAQAQAIWRSCWETGEWPDYSEDPVMPPKWLCYELYGRDADGDDLSELGLTGLEEQ